MGSRPGAIAANEPATTLVPKSTAITANAALLSGPVVVGRYWAFFAGTGLVDSEGACWLVKYLSVKGFNGCFGLGVRGHLDKPEAFRAVGARVKNDGH
jgi:hypothetical protein